MAKNKLGPGFSRFEFRPGVAGFPTWGGLDLRSDAAASPANTLRVAKNLRLWGKDVIARGGQSKLNTSAIGAVTGIFDTAEGEVGEQKLWGFAPYFPTMDTWYSQVLPVGDITDGYAYLPAIGVDGSTKVIRIFRIDKPVAGEVNLLYSGSASGADPFLLRAIGLTSATEVEVSGIFSPSTGSATAPPGTPVADLDVSAIGTLPTLGTSQLVAHWAESGIVYFSFSDGTNAKLYKADTNGGTVALVGTYALIGGANPISSYFFKLGSQILAIVRTGASSYDLVLVPAGTTYVVTANWAPIGTPLTSFHPAAVAVLAGKAYVAGSRVSSADPGLLEIDSGYAMALRTDIVAGSSVAETISTFGGVVNFHETAFDQSVTYDGAVFVQSGSAWGGPTTINAYPVRGYFHTDGRLYVLNPGGGGTVSLLRRSAVNSYATAFSDFGTLTASGASLPRHVGNVAMGSYLSVIL